MNHAAGNAPRTTALLTAVSPTPAAAAMFLRPRASASSDAVIMDTLYPQMVDQCKSTFSGLPVHRQNVYAYDMSIDVPEYAEIGFRLRGIREGFSGLAQREWAEKHGFGVTQWNNWEKGVRRIPVENAERLCELYGLTLDFVYRGRRDGLAETASKVV